jgi:hypothetical protein
LRKNRRRIRKRCSRMKKRFSRMKKRNRGREAERQQNKEE